MFKVRVVVGYLLELGVEMGLSVRDRPAASKILIFLAQVLKN